MVKVLAEYPVRYLQDQTYGLKTGDLVVFACGSGTGKSTFSRLLTFSAIAQGCPVALYSLEDRPGTFWKDYQRLMYIAETGNNIDFIAYELADSQNPQDYDKYRRASLAVKRSTNSDGLPMLDLKEMNPDKAWDISELEKSIAIQVQLGYKLFIIDHLDVLGEESVAATQRIMDALWAMVVKHDIAIIAFSQLSKALPERVLCPGAEHLRGANAKVLKSTLVVTMARDTYNYYALPGHPKAVANYMRIAKHRGKSNSAAIVYYENGNYLSGYREVMCNAPGTFIDGMTSEKIQKAVG